MFEDKDKITELEKFNRERCLANIVVAEEHMTLDGSIDGQTTHAWCVRKHIMIASDHMREAVEHTKNGELRQKYIEAKNKINEWLDNQGSLSELRNLRNWLRQVFKDESLPENIDENCDVCDRDSLMGDSMGKTMGETIDNLKKLCPSPSNIKVTDDTGAEKNVAVDETISKDIKSFVESNYAKIYEAINYVYGIPETKEGGEINHAVGVYLREKFPDEKVELVEGKVRLEKPDDELKDDVVLHEYLMLNKERFDFASDVFSSDGKSNPIVEYEKPDFVIEDDTYDTPKSRDLVFKLKEVVDDGQ